MGLSSEELVASLPRLYRYALALTGSSVAADDLVQDTAVKALAAAASFRGDSSPATWLHSILHRCYLDGARRRREDPHEAEALAAAVDAAWQDDNYHVDAAQVVIGAQRREDLLDALARLPDLLRSAVVLHDMEGLTGGEVAAIHEISLPAAKQRIRRGRAQLVSALDGAPDRRRARKGVPMTCWDARSMVGDYLDGELDQAGRRRLESHLAGCPTCPSLYAALVGVRAVLGDLRDTDKVIPAELAERVREHLAGHRPHQPD